MFNNKILLAAMAANILFLSSGIIQLVFSLVVHHRLVEHLPSDGRQAARNLLYHKFPLAAGIASGVLIVLVFGISLPGLLSRKRRGWLKASVYLVAVCAVFTLVLGCVLWVMTLRMMDMFYGVYVEQEPSVQGLMQASFQCCGYFNTTTPAFVTNPTCPSPAGAAIMGGCAHAVAAYLDGFIDDVFTALFCMTTAHFVYGLCIACLLKDRKEADRFREIDSKRVWGYNI